MWCNKNSESINAEYCYDCTENEECKQFNKIEEDKAKLDAIRSTELHTKTRLVLKSVFNVGDDELDRIVDSMFLSAVQVSQGLIDSTLQNMIRIKAVQYIDGKMSKHLDDLFDRILSDEILIISKDDKPLRINIEDKILSKMQQFFENKERHYGKSTLDEAISRIISEKIDVVFKEIKEETIEKFNKEMMGKMMKGMVKEIANDKKLLALLG